MAERPKNIAASSPRRSRGRKNGARRLHILAIIIVVIGILSTLSILSYSPVDEAQLDRLGPLDVLRLPFNETVKTAVAELHNRLGLVGALTANFFINGTVGYSSIVIPLLLILWGWVALRNRETRKPITVTNYALTGALLFSASFGVVDTMTGSLPKEWSGIVGAFLADILVKLLGGAGASIVLATALLITFVLAIDLDIHRSLDRAASLWAGLRSHARGRAETGEEPFEERDVMINKGEDEGREEEEREEPEPRAAAEEPEPPEVAEEDLAVDIAEPPRDEEHELPEPPEPAEGEEEEIEYIFPSLELLDAPRQTDAVQDEELKANAELVKAKLANFGVEIERVSVTPGPVVTLYELVPASGVKISRIVSLADDLALALAAKGIRIMAPIPGKSAVGVEIPNRNPLTVYLRSVLSSTKFRETKAYLPVAVGKTISGEVYTDDLAKMPHLLIAGSTGSGKSVGINTLLASLLFRLHPSEVKFIIIDPKKIELTLYGKLKHHFLAVSPEIDEEIVTTPENAVRVLKSVELEMEQRYDRLAAAGVRNIQDYNERFRAGRLKNTDTLVHRKMPYLIVVIDELADLMMTAAREVEEPIARLAQLARAVGVHLVLATQRPSVDVITGVIKANFPARIAYQVASKTDSRTILDMNGAEQLLGTGDMLYLPAGSPKPVRIQNAYISTEEVERVTDHISRQQGYARPFQLPSVLSGRKGGLRGASGSRDEFFEEAARLIVRHQQGSVSLLQRRLKVGYSRAARLVDELEAAGIVGPFDGSKAREVLVENDEELEQVLNNLD